MIYIKTQIYRIEDSTTDSAVCEDELVFTY